MKILMITTALGAGGAETHIVTLARELKRLGEDVRVISSGGELTSELVGVGVPHIDIGMSERSPSVALRAYFALRRAVKEWDPDVIHAHTRYTSLLASMLPPRFSGRLCFTAHADLSSDLLRKRLTRLGRETIAVSEDIKAKLLSEYGRNEEAVTVIPNGIDVDVFSPPKSEKREREKKRILFLSRLDSDCSDAARALCRIAPRLYRYCPDSEIVIGGGGDRYFEISAMAEDVNRSIGRGYVSLTGRVGDTAGFFSEGDFFVGVSRAALEAMASGLPTILAGDEGYIGEATEESLDRAERTNLCCRGEEKISADRLYDDICRLLSYSGEKLRRRGEALREYVKERHGIRDTARKTLEVYSRISGRSCLICGFYGQGNLGDEQLLRAAVARARNDGYRDIRVISGRGRSVDGTEAVGKLNAPKLIRFLRRSDTLIFGGGSVLQDATSFRSIFYYWSLIRLALLFGARIELWGNGLGPLRRRLSRVLARDALSSCSYCGFRDSESLGLAESIAGENKKKSVFALEEDLMLCLRRLYEGEARDKDEAYFVIAPRGRGKRRELKALVARIKPLKQRGRLVFFPMFPREDSGLCRRLARRLGGVFVESGDEKSFSRLVSGSDGVVSMRLHGLVEAKLLGKPFVGVGDDPKLISFCKRYEGEHCGG